VTPEISSAIAVLIGTLSTVLLMAGAYYFGPTKRQERRDAKNEEN
jgi:uncharacterized membrane protein YidH (DUF202 family)